jgi:NAD(P)-dependent dehydrogenase (short-subunit alcohol dehydrogenase family)
MKNKNLLITGGATRIGKEIALHFSKKDGISLFIISNHLLKQKI